MQILTTTTGNNKVFTLQLYHQRRGLGGFWNASGTHFNQCTRHGGGKKRNYAKSVTCKESHLRRQITVHCNVISDER